MNKLKVFSLAVLAGILSVGFVPDAKAQGPGGHGQGLENRVQKMKENLNLNDDQVAKVTAILKEQRQKMMALRNSGADQAAMKTQRQQSMRDGDAQISALLTPDQRTKWETMKAEMKANRANGGVKPEE